MERYWETLPSTIWLVYFLYLASCFIIHLMTIRKFPLFAILSCLVIVITVVVETFVSIGRPPNTTEWEWLKDEPLSIGAHLFITISALVQFIRVLRARKIQP